MDDDTSGSVEGQADSSPQFDAQDVSWAQSIGFEQSDIDTLGPQNLGMVRRAADRASAAAYQSQQSQQPYGQDQVQQGRQIDPMQFAAQLQLSKDDVDEPVINALNSVNSHYANQSLQFMGAIGELVSRLEKMSNTVRDMRFGAMVDSLGDDWHSVIGPPNARNANELQKLRNQTQLMQQMGTADYGEAFNRALGSLYWNKLASIERSKLNDKVQRSNNRVQERSASREEGPPTNPLESAARKVRKMQQEAFGAG